MHRGADMKVVAFIFFNFLFFGALFLARGAFSGAELAGLVALVLAGSLAALDLADVHVGRRHVH